jgi:hypothetical protein
MLWGGNYSAFTTHPSDKSECSTGPSLKREEIIFSTKKMLSFTIKND